MDHPKFDERYDVSVEIYNFQIAVARPTPKTPETHLKATVGLKLSGQDSEKLASHGTSYRTEIFTIDVDSGFPRKIGSREDRFKPHVLDYSYQLEVPMPDVGRYEIHSLIRMVSSGEVKAYHRGPVMRVTS
jgi:hypothetical protein